MGAATPEWSPSSIRLGHRGFAWPIFLFDIYFIRLYHFIRLFYSAMHNKAASSVEERATAGRLLDAAERLFGAHGLEGVGMRALAEAAGVNLGAASYHFGSKEALYLETFLRRFRPTNAQQLRLLQAAEAQADGRPVPVEKIAECLIRPPFESGRDHPGFREFLARNLFMPPPFLHAAMQKELEPNVAAFNAALRRSLPDIPVDLLHLRVMFAMGALLVFAMQAPPTAPVAGAKLRETLLRELVQFISAGLQTEPAVPAKDRPPLPFPPAPSR
jgi:AcrR family transcriptional regulator